MTKLQSCGNGKVIRYIEEKVACFLLAAFTLLWFVVVFTVGNVI